MGDGSNPDVEQLKKVVERCGVLVTMKKKSDFSTDTLVQDLNKLIMFEEGQQPNAHTLPQLELEIASAAVAAVIKYLEVCKFHLSFIVLLINILLLLYKKLLKYFYSCWIIRII